MASLRLAAIGRSGALRGAQQAILAGAQAIRNEQLKEEEIARDSAINNRELSIEESQEKRLVETHQAKQREIERQEAFLDEKVTLLGDDDFITSSPESQEIMKRVASENFGFDTDTYTHSRRQLNELKNEIMSNTALFDQLAEAGIRDSVRNIEETTSALSEAIKNGDSRKIDTLKKRLKTQNQNYINRLKTQKSAREEVLKNALLKERQVEVEKIKSIEARSLEELKSKKAIELEGLKLKVKDKKEAEKKKNELELAYKMKFDEALAKDRAKKHQDFEDDVRITENVIKNQMELLDSPDSIYSGSFSNLKLGIDKISQEFGLKLFGKTAENTESFVANSGTLVGRIITQFGSGTGLSDADREYAAKIAAGEITMTKGAIRRVLHMLYEARRIEAIGMNDSIAKDLGYESSNKLPDRYKVPVPEPLEVFTPPLGFTERIIRQDGVVGFKNKETGKIWYK